MPDNQWSIIENNRFQDMAFQRADKLAAGTSPIKEGQLNWRQLTYLDKNTGMRRLTTFGHEYLRLRQEGMIYDVTANQFRPKYLTTEDWARIGRNVEKARASIYEGKLPYDVEVPRSLPGEALGNAALSGAWVAATLHQYFTLGSAVTEEEMMHETAGVMINPLIWPLMAQPQPLSRSANKMNAVLKRIGNEQDQWINWVVRCHQNGQSVGNYAMQRARGYLDAQAELVIMTNGRVIGLSPEEFDRFYSIYNRPGAWVRMRDKYLGEEPDSRNYPITPSIPDSLLPILRSLMEGK